jgi:hypothetical protein
MTIVSEKNRAAIFLAPKCASTSIKDAFLGTEDWKRVEGKPKGNYEGMTTYAIVRNPYAIALSYWSYRMRTGVTDLPFEEFVSFNSPPRSGLDIEPLHKWYEDVNPTHILKLEQGLHKLPFNVNMKQLNAAPEELRATLSSDAIKHYSTKPINKINDWAGEDFSKYGYDRLEKEHGRTYVR